MEAKMDAITHSTKKLRQAVDGFWDTYPPLWRSIQAHIRSLAEEQFQITLEQFHLLRHIRRGRNSVSALAEMRGISRPAVSHSVDLLVTRGLIVRSVDPLDRRHVMLDLSAAGNSLMDTVFGDTRQWMMEKFAALTEDEIEALTGSLESLKRII